MHGVTHFAVSQRTGRGFGPGLFTELGPTSVVVGGQTFACSQSGTGGLPFACNGGRYILVADHSGALDEGLSDIFGTAVEFAFHPGGAGALRADYTIGEDLLDIGVIRSLQNPASIAVDAARGVFHPDHISRRIAFALVALPNGALALSNLGFVGSTPVVLIGPDDGGVHMNSTILSHAFYLAIEGGQNRTSGLQVRGVGTANRAQIERVFFRAVRDLLPSVTSFAQIGPVLRQAAIDVHGAGSPPAIAIQDALSAVGF
jgi:Zn-dependent metalloprotease